ncbi:TilS substrate-binding domain-containing protein [Massilia sp. Dwa41.01b]|uniref:TilS substrate-binding domain-containing protein n=1 Tax=Massilia sp. Dwa41.01b TaxID=2709302 RepID=UPI001E2862E2|nr:TilS substrate-binding domain-containing protein [Massilia sp. Dwa41.01b]
MSIDRVHNLLRHWFKQRALAMPSTAWLEEMVTQLLEAREDAQLLVTHPTCHIRRYRERLYITPKLPALAGMRDPDDEGVIEKLGESFVWRGEARLAFPAMAACCTSSLPGRVSRQPGCAASGSSSTSARAASASSLPPTGRRAA